jgi:hypothetical protein
MVMPHRFPFIVGSGRSGTTMVRAILDSHPDVAVPNETGFLTRMARRSTRTSYERPDGFDVGSFVSDLDREEQFRQWDLSLDLVGSSLTDVPVHGLADAIRRIYGLYASERGKTRYGDKTPSYVLRMPLLAELFPEACFVHVIRDGRDVALSYLEIPWGPRTIHEAALDWKRHVGRGRRAGRALGPGRYLEVRYEDIVEDPERVTRLICSFVGVGFEPAMLRYFERADELAAGISHFRNLYLPPTKGLRDWRVEMTPADAAVFGVLAGDFLDDLGYERGPRARGLARARVRRGQLGVLLAWTRTRARVAWRRLDRSIHKGLWQANGGEVAER